MPKKSKPSPLDGWPQTVGPNLALLAGITALFFWKLFLHPQLMLWGNDLVRGDSAFRHAIWESVWTWGRFPLWDPTTFCGKSIVGGQVYVLMNPLCFVSWLSPNPIFLGFFIWSQVTLGAWGTFLFARKLRCDVPGALFAAIAFALSGKTAGHVFAGHTFLVSAAMGLPWMLWAAESLLERRTIPSAMLLGGAAAITASFYSAQLTYVFLALVGVYVGVSALLAFLRDQSREGLRIWLLFAASLIVFLGASAAWWLPVVRQSLLLSARGDVQDVEFARMASVTPSDLMRLIWPFSGIPVPKPFVSDAGHRFFWETASYPGVVTLALSLVALFSLRRNPKVVVLAILGYAALLFSLADPNPLFQLAYTFVPGFRLFRSWGRLLFCVNLVAAVLAGKLLSEGDSHENRWATVCAVCGMLLAVFIATLVMTGAPYAPPRGRWIPLLVLLPLVTCGCLWASGDLSGSVWRGLCLCLLLVELFLCWQPHVQAVDPRSAFPPNAAASYLAERQKEDEFRVLDTTSSIPQQIAAREGLEIVTGYDPAVYAHHLEAYNKVWRQDYSDVVEVVAPPPSEIVCPAILDAMNVKYIVAFEEDLGENCEAVYRTPEYESRRPRFVHLRKNALPRAFIVPRAKIPTDGGTVLDALCALDPREACLVDGRPFDGEARFQNLSVERHSPSDIIIRFSTAAPGVVVVSQSWHPDYRATDHGAPVEVRRVNHSLIGVALSPGDHELRVWYYPWDFYLGALVSAATWMVVLATAVITRLWRRAMAATDCVSTDMK